MPGAPLLGAAGGTQSGTSDLYWVLTRVTVEGQDRTVLALYRAMPAGIKLQGVRWIGPDLEILEMGSERPRVKEILEELKKGKK